MPNKFPVFAYLDTGIYGHPIFNNKTLGVKIGYYKPSTVKKRSKIKDIQEFVEQCIPSLKDAKSVNVTEVDQCFYDITKDGDFIVGELSGFSNILVGAGWNGTGYKFAPLIGKILSQAVIGNTNLYNIARFSPSRFQKVQELK